MHVDNLIGCLKFKNGKKLNFVIHKYRLKIYIDNEKLPILEGHPNWLFATEIKNPPLWAPVEKIKEPPTNIIIYLNNKLIWIRQDLHIFSYPIHKNPSVKISSKNFYFLHSIKENSAVAAICNREEGRNELLYLSTSGIQVLDETIGPHDFSGENSLNHSINLNSLVISNKLNKNLNKEYKVNKVPFYYKTIEPNTLPFIHEKNADKTNPIQIFDFDNSIEFLKASFEETHKKNPRWSYRSWAEKMGLKSSTSLLKIINGKRFIGQDIQACLTDFFNFNNEESTYFSLLIAHEKNLKKDKNLSIKLLYEIHQLQKNNYIWSEFYFTKQDGIVRRIFLDTNIVELYFYNSKTASFSLIKSGYLISVMSNQETRETISHPNICRVPEQQDIGFDQIDSHLFFYNKSGVLSEVNLANFINNPFSQGKWESQSWINKNDVIIFYKNLLTKETFLVIATDVNIYITQSLEDLSKYKVATLNGNAIEFKDLVKNKTQLNIVVPNKPSNNFYFKNGIKHQNKFF